MLLDELLTTRRFRLAVAADGPLRNYLKSDQTHGYRGPGRCPRTGRFEPEGARKRRRCEPLSRILGKPYKTAAFTRHLEELSQESRGEILQKYGTGRSSRYRFLNPLLQP